MGEVNTNPDYTRQTISIIFFVTLTIIIYAYFINLFGLIKASAPSFQSTSLLLLFWRLGCLVIGISAIVYMYRCGPGNMRVISFKESEEVIRYPTGLSKFVTFSSWTLLANVSYFLLSTVNQLGELLGLSLPILFSQIQVIVFCSGIAMAFLTATIVRHIILPDEVKIRRNHEHMFLFHEQIMHNFAAFFLAVELILLQPELRPQFAIVGLFMGIVYVVFSYLFAYFGGGYIVYSFIHPRPKIAPILVFVLAGLISLFYVGLWFVSTLKMVLSIPILFVWICMIVQFQPSRTIY